MAASVEEAQGDEVVGGAEPVGDAGEQPQLGVDALGEPVGQAVGDRGDDPGAVLLDPVVELDEGGDLAAAGPGEPGVEHGDGLVAAMLEHEPQLFLQQVGPVEAVVVAGDPGQLGGLAGGEVLGSSRGTAQDVGLSAGGFPGPPSEPDVRLSPHPALHEPVETVLERPGPQYPRRANAHL